MDTGLASAMQKEDRKWRQKLKASAPHQHAELERDQALELTGEVLRIKHAEKAQERVAGHRSKAGLSSRYCTKRRGRKFYVWTLPDQKKIIR